MDGEMNVEELTVKCTVAFFGCVGFSVEKTKGAWSTIDDLVKDGSHSDVAGIRGEEEGRVRGWEIQGRNRCKRFIGCSEDLLLLRPPQERFWLARQGRI